MFELKNISKTFRDSELVVHAVKDVSLTVNEHDIYGIIGYSGAGKSTLIRCMNMLEVPSNGEVIFKGVNMGNLPITKLRDVRKKIGMIFQHFNLLSSLSVFGNVELPLKMEGVPKSERKEKVEKMLEFVGLEDKGSVYPSQLSGGQKQRVAIARALVSDPDVLLCDEATSALDPMTTHSILNLLKKLNEELGLTIILITHEMEVIRTICTKVAIMDDGEIVENGNVVDIFANPQVELTKTFLASTSSLHRAYLQLKSGEIKPKLKDHGQLWKLTYASNTSDTPLIAHLTREYGFDINILFADIQEIQGQSIGGLLVSVEGDVTKYEEAIAFVRKQKVALEVIAHD